MRHKRHIAALTLIEVVFIISVLGLLILIIAIMLPAFGAARRSARAMPNSTQLRGIHSGLVLYAQTNNGHYPGIMSDGEIIDPAVGLTAQGRTQILIEQNYFTLEYARSPSESQTGTTSFAMLKIDWMPGSSTITKSIRNSEWNDTTNGKAVVLSDRVVDNGGSYQYIKSIHTKPSPGTTDWRGKIGWNDNHVTFEATSIVASEYGKTAHIADSLFATSDDPENGNDAFMVWHGTDNL